MTTTLQQPQSPQPPPPPQVPQRITSCHRHPNQPVTGFCASCLQERLSGLEPAVNRPASTTTTTAAASAGKGPATRSVFFRKQNPLNPSSSKFTSGEVGSSLSLLPELRRCKSFSVSSTHGGPLPTLAFEPQRRSCDVRNTLGSLFHLDDHSHHQVTSDVPCSSSNAFAGEIEVVEPQMQTQNRGLSNFPTTAPVKEEEEEEEFYEAQETRVSSDGIVVEEEEQEEVKEEARPMKEHIDLHAQPFKKLPSKDLKDIAGSFWVATSVFSKKLQQWRRKHKLKKHGGDGESTRTKNALSFKGILGGGSKTMRSTQSEIAVDMFGRRSCDTEPRFSLDAVRMSLDDPRFSWDEPRASWDGYLIGGGARSVFSRLPQFGSITPAVQRSDGLIPVGWVDTSAEGPSTPGGTAQTRDYYLDSQRRRRSLERSSSLRRPVVDAENENPRPVASNAKVSPTTGNEFFHHMNKKFELEPRDSRLGSFGSSYQNNNLKEGQRPAKKSRRWTKAWNIWGLIHRRNNGNKNKNGGINGVSNVERSLSESWPELTRMPRSNSMSSSRHSFSGGNGMGSTRRKKREEYLFDRNRSVRHLDNNGMLRFYLTPMRSITTRRSSTTTTGRRKNSRLFNRGVFRL